MKTYNPGDIIRRNTDGREFLIWIVRSDGTAIATDNTPEASLHYRPGRDPRHHWVPLPLAIVDARIPSYTKSTPSGGRLTPVVGRDQ